jgi:lipoprotein-anchoring transpeptidase ErfK/SrfK
MAKGRHVRHRRVRAAVIVSTITGVLLLAAGGAAYAAYRYERAHADRILPGVRISGIDVGGMTRSEAEHVVKAAAAQVLRKQLVVRVGDTRWVTTPSELGRRADIAGAVTAALAAGQEMGTFDRFWHRFRDEPLDRDVDLAYRTKGDAVSSLAKRIAHAVYIAPRSSSIGITADHDGITFVHAKAGARLNKDRAAQSIQRAIVGDRGAIRLETVAVKPKATESTMGRTIVVRVDENKLFLYDGFDVIRSWPVATAKPGFTTPDGDWAIYDKQVDPTWHNPAPDGWGAGEPLEIGPGPGNPMGPRALYITAPGLIRIHGTSDPASIGRYASHGCIRMNNDDIVTLYPMVPVRTTVLVVGHRPAGAAYWDTPPGKDT